MSCSRTQHGGGRSRTPDLSLRSPTLYHWATALPFRIMWVGVWYHVKCLGHDTLVRQHYKSEHWAPCRNQTLLWYDWKIVESDVKPEQTTTTELAIHCMGVAMAQELACWPCNTRVAGLIHCMLVKFFQLILSFSFQTLERAGVWSVVSTTSYVRTYTESA